MSVLIITAERTAIMVGRCHDCPAVIARKISVPHVCERCTFRREVRAAAAMRKSIEGALPKAIARARRG